MKANEHDVDYFFRRGEIENPRFWNRFGGRPDFTNRLVGDVGCGYGSLDVDIAAAGARKVIGFDLDATRIESAREIVQQYYPEVSNKLEFRLQDIGMASERDFDFFVSKDTFEHVIELPKVLQAMKERLKPGGRIYIGFGPLWNSPYGDHRRTRIGVPWGHVLFSERFLIKRVNRLGGYCNHSVNSFYDLDLNTFSLAEYRRIFTESGLKAVFFKVNHSTRPVSRLFSSLSKLPYLQEYFSHNIYCILEKTAF